jgi:cysteine-rich repeat protein
MTTATTTPSERSLAVLPAPADSLPDGRTGRAARLTEGWPRARAVVALVVITAFLAAPRSATARIHFDDFTLPVGDNPQAVTASDCDADGVPDLVVASFGANTVTILRNDGATFSHDRTFPVGAQPAGATCADFDGDGITDVAVSSFADGTVAVYRGEAGGTMTPIGAHPVGLQPRSVAAADFDGDGAIDLLVVNARSSGMSVLLGDGTGGFPFGATIRLPAEGGRNTPLAAAVADFDANGRADIAVVSQGQPPLRLLLGDGVGFRFTGEALPFPPNPRGTAAADLNDDGLVDLAVLSTDSTIRLYAGQSGGRFASGRTVLAHADARSVALADFDGDGLPDLATAHGKTNSVAVLHASAPAVFPTSASSTTAPALNAPGPLAVRTTTAGEDVVGIDAVGRALTALTAPDSTALAVQPLAALAGAPQQVLLADLNGDGVADAIVALAGRDRPLQVLLGDTAGGYAPAPTGPAACGNGIVEGGELCDDGNTAGGDGCGRTCAPEVAAARAMQAADLDGDGRRDLVLTDKRGKVWALHGDGRGAFRSVRTIAHARAGTGAVVAPFGGDEAADIAFVPRKARLPLALLANDGHGGFTQRALATDPGLVGPFVAADFDRNGFVDLAVGRRRPSGVAFLYNDGDGPTRPGPSIALGAKPASLAAADFDEDGWVDLLASFSGQKSAPRIWLGSPDGGFREAPPPVESPSAVTVVADLNEDLHQDVVACSASSLASCRLRYGDGTAAFAEAPPNAASAASGAYVGRQARGAAAADLDGDGHVDFVGASRRDHRVVVLYGSRDPAVVERLELQAGTKPTAVGIGDLDGDGRSDLVATNEGSNDLSLFLNRGRGRFASLARIALPAATLGAGPLALGDLDGDGRLDVVVGLAAGSGVVPYLNRGPGGLVNAGILATGSHPQAVALGDVDGDDRLDIVTADVDDDSLSVLRSRAGYAPASVASGGMRPTDVAVADVNLDGAPDLVAVHDGSRTLATLLNDGDGTFGEPAITSLPGRRRPWDLCVGDFDADDVPDVAVGSLGTTDVLALFGRGDGGWAPELRLFPIGQDPRPLFCADVDGDGRSDVVFTRRRSGRLDAIVTGDR